MAASAEALSKAAAKVAETSALGIFDRPIEPAEAEEVGYMAAEAATPAAPEKTDLQKYLLLLAHTGAKGTPRCSHGESCATTKRPPMHRRGAQKGCRISHARRVSGWVVHPPRRVSSASSPRRAPCYHAPRPLRARWRTAPSSTPSLPTPAQSEAEQGEEGSREGGDLGPS